MFRPAGCFLKDVNSLSPRIINYLNRQLGLSPALIIDVPTRKATHTEQRQNILNFLKFQKFDEEVQSNLQTWLENQAFQGKLPNDLFQRTERYLLENRVILPGPSVLERLIISACSGAHDKIFQTIFLNLSPDLKGAIEKLLSIPEGEQNSYFNRLKEYPPSAKISSLRDYLVSIRKVPLLCNSAQGV